MNTIQIPLSPSLQQALSKLTAPSPSLQEALGKLSASGLPCPALPPPLPPLQLEAPNNMGRLNYVGAMLGIILLSYVLQINFRLFFGSSFTAALAVNYYRLESTPSGTQVKSVHQPL